MLYLFPANGISSIAYSQFVNYVSPYQVNKFTYSPLINANIEIPKDFHWQYFIDEINRNHSDLSNAVGIGHSLGGTLLLHNAISYPERWKTIFIIEPALFSPWINKTYQFVRFLKLENLLHPMIRITKPRREFFESKEDTFKRWRLRPVFSYLSDISLQHFIDASLIESNNGYSLRFPKNWECEVYRNMCTLDPFIWKNLSSLNSKLIVIGAETSNTFFESSRRRLMKYATEFISIPNTTHLLPFETPLALSRIILKHL